MILLIFADYIISHLLMFANTIKAIMNFKLTNWYYVVATIIVIIDFKSTMFTVAFTKSINF